MKVTDWLMNDFTDHAKSIPIHWKCPTCIYGILTLVKEKFLFEETAESKRAKHNQSPVYAEYLFTGLLTCNNASCQDIVSISGKAYESDYEKQVSEHEYETVDFIQFEPLYFFPALHLFEIPKECPKKVSKEIVKAFGHFFNDTSACANKIRMAIELILTDQKVKTTVINRHKKREMLNLHTRIGMFKKGNLKFETVRNRLLAIKWIGNDGSHSHNGHRLKPLDLLTAFELLEYILEGIYGDKEKRLSLIAMDVNKRKGIIPKRITTPKFLKGI